MYMYKEELIGISVALNILPICPAWVKFTVKESEMHAF